MDYVKFELTDNEKISCIASVGKKSTPVWRQARWDSGEYAVYVRNNGCGHCCAAMALQLHGIQINPHEEYELCRKLWGVPNENGKPIQHHFMSISGISKIMKHFNIPAKCYNVPESDFSQTKSIIISALSEGKQVAFWSQPSPNFPENPFSKGEHYVMAIGFLEDGKIAVANSSEKMAPQGVQGVTFETIEKALYHGSEPTDMTWGEPEHYNNCAGFVVIG